LYFFRLLGDHGLYVFIEELRAENFSSHDDGIEKDDGKKQDMPGAKKNDEGCLEDTQERLLPNIACLFLHIRPYKDAQALSLRLRDRMNQICVYQEQKTADCNTRAVFLCSPKAAEPPQVRSKKCLQHSSFFHWAETCQVRKVHYLSDRRIVILT
jgi:hypothetical protein